MEWTQCPQCGLVAEVVDRDVWPSTDGPVEHVHVRCADGHRFVMPAAALAPAEPAAQPTATQRAGVRVRTGRVEDEGR